MMKLITAYLDQVMFLIVETPYFPFFTSFLLCILAIFWKRSRARGLKSLPGPWKLPFIGNLHQMVGALPHHTLRDLAKKHGPIMHLKLGQLEAVIISSAKAAREVLKTHELAFAQRPMVFVAEVMSYGQGSMVFAPYGDLWRSQRKICTFELLSPKRVQSFRSLREEEGFDFEYTPFGAGRRICPGMSFSVTMIELALAELLYRFDWKLANGMNPDELDMTESFGLSCKRKNALYLIATPHFTSLGSNTFSASVFAMFHFRSYVFECNDVHPSSLQIV
ncbi:hypothetical protein ACFX1Q_024137 [Malus domestica]